jgi:hypothetical protein
MELGLVKFILSIFISNLIRFFSFIPNNDPIMALMLPYSRQQNVVFSFFFPFLTMISFDVITGNLGFLTLVTSITYGLLGLFFVFVYKNRKIGVKSYLLSGTFGVIVFDFVTGCVAFPIFFGISFEQAFIGQIPFTFIHLITVSAFVLVITPLADKHLFRNKYFNDNNVKKIVEKIFILKA